MTGLVIDGKRVAVPGVEVVTWLDDPRRAPRVTKVYARQAADVSAVVLHTSKGRRPVIVPEHVSSHAWALARYQASTKRAVSWHFTIAHDGTVIQQADAATAATWHAGHANRWSVGIELAQDDTLVLSRAQVDSAIALVRVLCREFCVPFRVPCSVLAGGAGSLVQGPVRAWQPRREGGDSRVVHGVVGHRSLTRDRGAGDPGDPLLLALLDAGADAASVEEMSRDVLVCDDPDDGSHEGEETL